MYISICKKPDYVSTVLKNPPFLKQFCNNCQVIENEYLENRRIINSKDDQYFIKFNPGARRSFGD